MLINNTITKYENNNNGDLASYSTMNSTASLLPLIHAKLQLTRVIAETIVHPLFDLVL